MISLNRLSAVILLVTGIIVLTPCKGQTDPLTLGIMLNQMLNKVGGLITAAQNAGNHLVVAAGGEVQAAILMAKGSYDEELNRTADTFSQKQKELLDDLTTKVGYLETNATSKLKEIVTNGAVAINSIPFSKTFPQLGSYVPPYTLPASATSVKIEGNFFDAAREGYKPYILLDQTKIDPVTQTTKELQFSIPGPTVPAPSNSITYRQATLVVPYKTSCYWLFSCKEEARFDVRFSGLPSTAGRIDFLTTATEPWTETQQKISGQKAQISAADDIPDPRANGFQHCVQPDPGWTVDTSTVSLVVEQAEGDWIDNGNTSNIANACWNITTVHHAIGTSGKVWFKIKFTQKRDTTRQVTKPTQTANLGWGNSRSFAVPAHGTWTAIYSQFDGSIYNIISPVFENSFLSVQTSGSNILFRTIP